MNSSKSRTFVVAVLAGISFGCTNTAPLANQPDSLGWLTGCWQLEDKSVEETWTKSIHGDQLFGYSVNTQNSERVFFEQLRIDIDESDVTLSAYPGGIGPTAFEGKLTDATAVEFVNENNDYPQRISYARQGDRLAAKISLMDNTRPASWNYRRCTQRR